MITEYSLVMSKYKDTFVKQVNIRLSDGYTLVGGVFVDRCNGHPTFVQSFTKERK